MKKLVDLEKLRPLLEGGSAKCRGVYSEDGRWCFCSACGARIRGSHFLIRKLHGKRCAWFEYGEAVMCLRSLLEPKKRKAA